jgi:hypothetical protein
MDEWMTLLRDVEKRLSDLTARVDLSDAAIRSDLQLIRADIKRLEMLQPDYVTRPEFTPVQKIVFGAVGLALSTLLLAVIGLVVVGGGL